MILFIKYVFHYNLDISGKYRRLDCDYDNFVFAEAKYEYKTDARIQYIVRAKKSIKEDYYFTVLVIEMGLFASVLMYVCI